MRRRDFVARIAGLATWPLAGRAQPIGVGHLGVLLNLSESDVEAQRLPRVGCRPAFGGRWHATTVAHLIARLAN
jgi:hypothetical protein